MEEDISVCQSFSHKILLKLLIHQSFPPPPFYALLKGTIVSSITALMCRVGSYRMVVLLTHFYQRKLFVYSINVLKFQ